MLETWEQSNLRFDLGRQNFVLPLRTSNHGRRVKRPTSMDVQNKSIEQTEKNLYERG